MNRGQDVKLVRRVRSWVMIRAVIMMSGNLYLAVSLGRFGGEVSMAGCLSVVDLV